VIDEVSNPYARFSVRLLLPQNELSRIPSTLPLEGGGAPEFFVVILPSSQTVKGDDFRVEVLPGGISYGLNAKDSGETVQTKVITFNIQQPPQISFLEPLPGTTTPWPGSVPYDIRWTDFDPDDNAQISLYYFVAGENPSSATVVKTLINEDPLQEDPDGTQEDSYSWDLSQVSKAKPLQILAVISDGVNEATAVSGILAVSNEAPKFEFVVPVVDVEAPGDYFTIRWTDNDPDDNALIDLYLVCEDPQVSPSEIWVATGIEEDADGTGDTFNLPVRGLMDAKLIFADTPYRVRAEISDGLIKGATLSPGTITPVLLPAILVTAPAGTELMNNSGTIRWTLRLPFGNGAAVELFWIADSALSAATRATIGQPLEYEIPVAESQRIVQLQTSALAGEHVWSVVSPGEGGRLEFNLPEDFPYGDPIRIYAKIVDEAHHFRTTVSAGQFIIREHFLIMTTPAYQIPSATTVVTDDPPFAIRWEGESKDPNAKVSLYRDVDNQGFDGIMLQNFDSRYPGTLATNIPLAAGEFLWNVTDVPLGSYYIYAVVSDNVSQATDPLFAGYSPGYIRVGQVVDSLVWVDTLGYLRLTGGGVVDPQPELPYGVEIRAIEMAKRSGELFLLGSEGQVYRQDGTLVEPGLNFGWDAAQDLEVVKGGRGLYVLDVLGGIRPLKEADYYGVAYFGWDIARDLTSTPGEQGYLVLDGFGGVHAFGDAPQVDGPFFSWDIARDVEMTPDGSGMLLLDGFGGVHALGSASLQGSVYFGWDVARDLLMNEGGTGYYVLDAFGSIYGFGEASTIDAPSQSVAQALAAANGDAHLFLEVKTLAEWDLGAAQAIPDADPATSAIPGEATGNWVVWVNQPAGATTGRDLFYYNSTTGEQGTLVARVQTQDNPSLDGNMAVWNSRETGDWDIFLMKQMPDGEIVKISQGPQNQRYPDISEGVVVWQDYDLINSNWDIYLYNSNQANPVAVNVSPGTRGSNQQYPAVFTTAADASGERDVYVAWVDNRNGDTNQDVYLFHGQLDAQGDLVLPLEAPVAVAAEPGNQLEPDLGFNPYYEPGVLTLAYTDSSQGDLNMFYVFIDLETVQPIEGTLRTVPSAGPRNRNIPKDVNAQFAPAISTERVAYIDRRSGFWDVYMSDFQVASRNAQTEMDGEIRITDTRQQVTELAAAGTKLVWMEAEGGKVRLQLGSLEIVKLVQGKVFSSSKADQKRYLSALAERQQEP
jgi:beta propeller repeat protein